MSLLTYQNSKLHNQLIFDLPVDPAICGRQCPGCYALKAQRRFPAVLTSRLSKYTASQQPDFSSLVIAEITKCKRPLIAVRIHSSGEFYSQSYIDSWLTIATTLPNVKFYAFTKRLKDFDFSQLMSLPNVVIIDSLMHGRINYGKASTLLPTVFTCPNTSCGIQCTYCMTKVAQSNGVQFVQH